MKVFIISYASKYFSFGQQQRKSQVTNKFDFHLKLNDYTHNPELESGAYIIAGI